MRQDVTTPRLHRSQTLLEQAEQLIPWGTQTRAKRVPAEMRDVFPSFIERGEGCRFWDVDGHSYIDFQCALGPVILGYADADVNAAAIDQMQHGLVFNAAHPLELELARLLQRVVPCAERVRLLKSGGDATTAAVRVARAVTGRERVVSIGYHGWHDWTLARDPRVAGIPQVCRDLLIDVPPYDVAALELALREHGREVALAIVDPVVGVDVTAEQFHAIARLTRQAGALLCFDEVKSGFRLALGGAQEHWGVDVDLACYSKGLANGFSIAALCGRASVMDVALERTVITGTFYGSAMEIAAAVACIEKIERERVVDHLWSVGRRVRDAINAGAARTGAPLRTAGPACAFRVMGDGESCRRWQRELLQLGVYPGRTQWFTMYAHREQDVEEACRLIETAFDRAFA